MREQAIFDLEHERRDPRSLYRILKGGYSKGAERAYAGLGQRVLKRITELYALPRPMGYSSSTGYDKVRSGSSQPEADTLELARFLARWLGERDPIDRVDRDTLLGLARQANEQALRMVNRARVSEARAEHVLELVNAYLAWLGRSCEHRRARMIGESRVRECPECGAIEIET